MKENEIEKKVIEVKRYTLTGLAKIYGVHRNTFMEWIKPLKEILGKRRGYYYSIEQVKIIFANLQFPSFVVIEVESEEGLYKKVQIRKD